MCGGSGTSTQQVSIPPEVLARYNSVNAQAQQVAQQPFHIYSTDPSAFVAPINPQQMAGIENVNQAVNIPTPYFGAATQYLTGAAGAAQPYFDYASQQLTGGAQAGLAGTTAAYNPMAAGAQYAQGLQGGALGQYGAATSMAQPYNYLAGENIMGAQAGARPYQQAATTFGLAGATPVMPGQLGSEQINRYMSPYMSNVVEATLAPLRQQQQIEQSTLAGNQIGAGAFGGERGRIAQAVLAQQQNLATAKTAADLLQQGYGQALGTAQQQQQLGLGAEQANRQAIQQASQQMLGIGQQGFGQGLASSQALSGLGQQVYGQQAGYGQNLAQLAQQGFGQGAAQTAQQAALAQQLYGIGTGTAGQAATLGQGVYGLGANTAQSLAGLGSGFQQAALQGAQAQIGAGTLGQQTQQAGLQALYNQFLQQQGYPFQVAQFLANIAMGTGALSGTTTQTTQPMGFMGSLSDKRAKEDIEPIGKTFDGQDIVKYRYKGEPQKQIGLIAQDVEKHHPEAVGLAGGLKTVDYDRATKDAAKIGKSSEGGKVIPFPERRGYFDGGYAGGLSPSQIGEILASQAQMYGGTDHPGLGESRGTTPGLSGYVPGASLPVGELMSPTSAPELPKTTLQDIDAGIGLYKSGKSLFEDEDDNDGSPSKRYGGGLSRHHYAIGGDANAPYGGNDMPYGDEDTKSNVPTSIPGLAGASKMEKPEPLKPASPPSSSGSSDLGDLASLAKFAMMFAANGGRINKDYGGGLFGNTAGSFDPELERRQIADALVRQRDLSEDPAARPPEPRLARPIVPTATAPQFKTEPSFFVQPSTPKAEMPQFDVDFVDRGLLAKSQNAPVLAPPIPTMVRPQTANSSAPTYDNPIEQQLETARRYYQYANEGQRRDLSDADIGKFRRDASNLVKDAFETINTQFYNPPPSQQYAFRDPEGIATLSSQNAAQKGLGLSLRPSEKRAFQASAAETEKARLAALKAYGLSPSGELGPTPFTPYIMGPDANAQFINPQRRSDGSAAATQGLVPGRQTTSNIGASNVSRQAPRKPGLGGSGNVNLVPPVVAGPGYVSGDENRRVSALEGMYEPENIGGLNPPAQTAEGMMGGDVAGGLSAGDIKSIPAGGLAGAPATQRAEVLPPESKASEGRDFLTRAGDFLAPKGGFFDKLSEGKEEAIIPLLRGLGAAATSNNRYLLGSLLAGAGAGAAAYGPTLQAQIERKKKTADVFTERQVGAQKAADNAKQMWSMSQLGLLRPDMSGPIIDSFGNRYSAANGAKTLQGAAAGYSSSIGPTISAALEQARDEWMKNAPIGGNMNPSRVEQSEEMATNVNLAGQDAVSQIPAFNKQASALFSPERTGVLSQGALAPIFEPYVAKYNAFVEAMGYPQAAISGLSDVQIANKLAIAQQAGLATGANQNSFAALQQFAQRVPSAGLDKKSAANLMSQLVVQQLENLDRSRIINEGRVKVGGNFETQTVLDAISRERGYTPADYAKTQQALSSLYLSNDWPAISAGLLAPSGSPQNIRAIKTIDAFGSASGVNSLSRAFTGVR